MYEVLCGCDTFCDILVFVSGGLPGLKADFASRNSLTEIQRTVSYLIQGKGLMLERAYDYDEKWRPCRFG